MFNLSFCAILLIVGSRLPLTDGSFRVLNDSRASGEERFEIIASPDHTTVKSTSNFTLEGKPQKIAATTEMQRQSLVRYEVEITTGEHTKKYAIDFQDGQALIKVEIGGQKTERRREISQDAILLDTNVWHHYRFLLARYDMQKKGEQQFTVFIPQAALRQYDAEVEFRKRTSITIAGIKRAGNLFDVRVANSFEVVAFTDEVGELLSLEFPAEKLKIVRQ